jgi:acetate kinase
MSLLKLERYVSLAPLHQPNNLAPIRTLLLAGPSFRKLHASTPRSTATTAPWRIISRYPKNSTRKACAATAFHGLSYEYIADRLRQIAPEAAKGRVIVAHLGSGASMCALADGRSVESTFGFTALDGLPMGTRPGQLDPGVVLYLIAEKGMSATAVQDLFYKESG